ncbi:MAG: DUF480 domain-containing protein [Pirellulales bacterium]|nr:DUF480 domain-containing protein [Pirellulales bacterium]
MTETPDAAPAAEGHASRWRPLNAIDRRVLGVLAEKAKTTPDAYPLSLNAVCTGCNQKSNRVPLMQLEPDDVEPSLDRLREMGAVGIVQGYGRVSKYRHYLYEWLGVDKVELAVMTELLLRGAQTEGELRARAARMEPIPGLPELRPVLQSLKNKNLVIALTPEGRGHVVAHNLCPPGELERLRAQYAHATPADEPGDDHDSHAAPRPAAAGPLAPRHDWAALRDEVAELRQEVASLSEQLRQLTADLESLRQSLGA